MTTESPSEAEARSEIEAYYGQTLDRVQPDNRPSPDYALRVSGSPPAGFEVKELTSHDYQQLHAAMDKQPTHMDVPTLLRRWDVMLEAKPWSERLVAVPDFPEDDEEQISFWAENGFVVQRRVDRVREWKQTQGARHAPVRLKNLIADLIDPLRALEENQIFATRGADPETMEARRALQYVAARTNNAICLGHKPHPEKGWPSGVHIVSGWGAERTENPNTLAERVQAWLDSELSSNMINSLARDEYGERHGVLVFDPMEPEMETARRNPEGYLPTDPVDLPAPLTHIWCILGPVVLRYSSLGWERRHRAAGPYASGDQADRRSQHLRR
jgi:hypothetical protein